MAIRIRPFHRSYTPRYSDSGSMATWPKGAREIYWPPSSPPTCPSPLDKPKGKPEDRGSREHRIPDLRSASSGTGLGGRVSTDVQGKQKLPRTNNGILRKNCSYYLPIVESCHSESELGPRKTTDGIKTPVPWEFCTVPFMKNELAGRK